MITPLSTAALFHNFTKIVSVKYYLTTVLICISMMTKEVKHFFISTGHLYFLFFQSTLFLLLLIYKIFYICLDSILFSYMFCKHFLPDGRVFHFISFDNCTFFYFDLAISIFLHFKFY